MQSNKSCDNCKGSTQIFKLFAIIFAIAKVTIRAPVKHYLLGYRLREDILKIRVEIENSPTSLTTLLSSLGFYNQLGML